MKWIWNIGRLAGIDLKVHATFGLLLLWVALSGLSSGGPLGSMLGVVLALVVFSVVVLHELGHSLAARRYGIPTKDIILTPIGGIARLQGMPAKPREEMVVAAAGPAVNLVLALGAYLLLAASPMSLAYGLTGTLATWFIYINMGLLLFNLIPAFPMDGGRILRAALTLKHGPVVATEKATRVARYLAVAMGIFGLLTFRWTLVFIAVFVYVTSTAELWTTRLRSVGVFRPAPRPERIQHGVEILDDPYYKADPSGQGGFYTRTTRF